jgi:hypothetical protein
MARFAIIEGGTVANIVEAGVDFAASQGWIDATGASIGDLWGGAQFTPAPPPPPVVPAQVTMRQARLALLQAGQLSGVQPVIDAMPSPQKDAAQIEWDHASEVRRDSALVAMLGIALALDSAAIDSLFITASAL